MPRLTADELLVRAEELRAFEDELQAATGIEARIMLAAHLDTTVLRAEREGAERLAESTPEGSAERIVADHVLARVRRLEAKLPQANSFLTEIHSDAVLLRKIWLHVVETDQLYKGLTRFEHAIVGVLHDHQPRLEGDLKGAAEELLDENRSLRAFKKSIRSLKDKGLIANRPKAGYYLTRE